MMEEPSGKPPTRVNPYKVLRVKKDASDEEIKKSYKQLALRHHPGILCLSTFKPCLSLCVTA